jgi:hypothetical protein
MTKTFASFIRMSSATTTVNALTIFPTNDWDLTRNWNKRNRPISHNILRYSGRNSKHGETRWGPTCEVMLNNNGTPCIPYYLAYCISWTRGAAGHSTNFLTPYKCALRWANTGKIANNEDKDIPTFASTLPNFHRSIRLAWIIDFSFPCIWCSDSLYISDVPYCPVCIDLHHFCVFNRIISYDQSKPVIKFSGFTRSRFWERSMQSTWSAWSRWSASVGFVHGGSLLAGLSGSYQTYRADVCTCADRPSQFLCMHMCICAWWICR